jgi:phosphate transport system permease protein
MTKPDDVAFIAPAPIAGSAASFESIHTTGPARARLRKRYGRESVFKWLGLGAVMVACGFLALLLYTIVSQAIPAFTYHNLVLPVSLSQEVPAGQDPLSEETLQGLNYDAFVRNQVRALFPFATSRDQRRVVSSLVSSGAGVVLRQNALNDPEALMSGGKVVLPLDDVADLYFKDMLVDKIDIPVTGIASPTGTTGDILILSTSNDFIPVLNDVKKRLQERADALRGDAAGLSRSIAQINRDITRLNTLLQDATPAQQDALRSDLSDLQANRVRLTSEIELLQTQADNLEQRLQAAGAQEELTDILPTLLVRMNGGVVKATQISGSAIAGTVIIPLQSQENAPAGEWTITEITTPEANRKISDEQIVLLDYLQAQGYVERDLNWQFFSAGASREPELAGVWGAVIGSFLTMVITLALSFPLGVAAAIYLEEFAPKNRWTQLIEVNINNLAAVPSIVFGLLGLAVFLNWFDMPRSAPVVGGMVLALMTLPTIIIASRAAIRAVPPSIREAALGVGASKLQTVFHHVLPLAMPGIFTGTIIGMAQALGETAPLLMIGMVAFIVDIPGGFTDPATVLPVQIYMWADFPEPAFQQKTSAAIVTLLSFLVAMNLLAVVLRKKFERRW